MARCDLCGGEMLKVKGCNDHIYLLNDGRKVQPVRVGEKGDWLHPDELEEFGWKQEEYYCCGECNASIGETHHAGCDTERCRVCGGQFISCACDYADKLILVSNDRYYEAEDMVDCLGLMIGIDAVVSQSGLTYKDSIGALIDVLLKGANEG